MSKRHRKSKFTTSFDEDYSPVFDGDMFQAPKGRKPKGKEKRRQLSHKMAYYD